jgi:23S rRNA (cytidine1920-2'-O)/16S rRNA (cytidine1409-2'-O)-methyltransferase
MAGRERLDRLLVDRGLVESRARAQALIMAGRVRVNGERVDKAGTFLSTDCVMEVDEGRRWASRGALKLLKALEVFSFDVRGRVCVDIGASTGGFTDVLLDAGAGKVCAVDVGYGQLCHRLAVDPRVVVMDRTNARTLTPDRFEDVPERVVCDASFISLRLLLPAVDLVLSGNGEAVVLIKPQFEAGRERLGRGGVVRDPAVHRAVIGEVLGFAEQKTRLRPVGLSWSPVRGPEGNVEFLCHLKRPEVSDAGSAVIDEFFIDKIVKDAFLDLKN